MKKLFLLFASIFLIFNGYSQNILPENRAFIKALFDTCFVKICCTTAKFMIAKAPNSNDTSGINGNGSINDLFASINNFPSAKFVIQNAKKINMTTGLNLQKDSVIFDSIISYINTELKKIPKYKENELAILNNELNNILQLYFYKAQLVFLSKTKIGSIIIISDPSLIKRLEKLEIENKFLLFCIYLGFGILIIFLLFLMIIYFKYLRKISSFSRNSTANDDIKYQNFNYQLKELLTKIELFDKKMISIQNDISDFKNSKKILNSNSQIDLSDFVKNNSFKQVLDEISELKKKINSNNTNSFDISQFQNNISKIKDIVEKIEVFEKKLNSIKNEVSEIKEQKILNTTQQINLADFVKYKELQSIIDEVAIIKKKIHQENKNNSSEISLNNQSNLNNSDISFSQLKTIYEQLKGSESFISLEYLAAELQKRGFSNSIDDCLRLIRVLHRKNNQITIELVRDKKGEQIKID